jgi:hypothetical protein
MSLKHDASIPHEPLGTASRYSSATEDISPAQDGTYPWMSNRWPGRCASSAQFPTTTNERANKPSFSICLLCSEALTPAYPPAPSADNGTGAVAVTAGGFTAKLRNIHSSGAEFPAVRPLACNH